MCDRVRDWVSVRVYVRVDVLVSVISAVNPSHQRLPVMEVCKEFVDAMFSIWGNDVISALKSNQVLTPKAEPVSECF